MSGLAPYWQIAAKSRELARKPRRVFIDGQHLVLFRTASGKVGVIEDRCLHRNAPLSQGRVCGETLQCPYHG
jgi:phenylpropionate dioxygenase-like ring-hydroxylating dioxygenase large terminal subunit